MRKIKAQMDAFVVDESSMADAVYEISARYDYDFEA